MHDRQAAFEPRRLGDGYMVAEGGDLVANTLKGVAVPTSVDNKATSDGIALGLVADKFDVHNFRGFSYLLLAFGSRNLINLIALFVRSMYSVIDCHRSTFWEHPKRDR